MQERPMNRSVAVENHSANSTMRPHDGIEGQPQYHIILSSSDWLMNMHLWTSGSMDPLSTCEIYMVSRMRTAEVIEHHPKVEGTCIRVLIQDLY